MSNNKVEQIVELFRSIDPNFSLQVEEKEDGSTFIVGPYPSLIILLDMDDRPDGFIVSVNADAPNATYFVSKLVKEFPDMEHYGPYGEIPDTGEIVFHEEAYQVKEDNIVMLATEIVKARTLLSQEQPGILVPEEKKIIIGV